MLLLELMDACYCFDIQNRGTRQTISLVMIMREQCSKNFTGSSNHIRLGFLAIMFLKKRDDLGKFRQLDEIIFINDYPGYQHLMSIAENCIGVVCEIKEIGSSNFFRLDDSKVLAWLYCKVFQLKKALCSLDKNYAAQDEKYTLAEAVSILKEYVKDEPWLMLLLDHLKLNLLEVTSKVPEAKNFPTNAEHNPVSSSLVQVQIIAHQILLLRKIASWSEDKTKRSGKQAKKAKVETESRNIREMFRRACRKS
ncbi:hypothetical protein BDE02_06G247000 [Populus trichocarpa]|nr:hypothetical protein BDE02_06G247000 [Populus trichocarpa]